MAKKMRGVRKARALERRKDEDYERKARAESRKAKIRIVAKVDRGELIG